MLPAEVSKTYLLWALTPLQGLFGRRQMAGPLVPGVAPAWLHAGPEEQERVSFVVSPRLNAAAWQGALLGCAAGALLALESGVRVLISFISAG